jgi:hypothetical protein|eukprot:SAG25_NODE_520_length_7225_cov_3.754420_10_plen_49_part_00
MLGADESAGAGSNDGPASEVQVSGVETAANKDVRKELRKRYELVLATA